MLTAHYYDYSERTRSWVNIDVSRDVRTTTWLFAGGKPNAFFVKTCLAPTKRRIFFWDGRKGVTEVQIIQTYLHVPVNGGCTSLYRHPKLENDRKKSGTFFFFFFFACMCVFLTLIKARCRQKATSWCQGAPCKQEADVFHVLLDSPHQSHFHVTLHSRTFVRLKNIGLPFSCDDFFFCLHH